MKENTKPTQEALHHSDLMIGNIVLDSTKNTTVVETIIPDHNRVYYGKLLTNKFLNAYGFNLDPNSNEYTFSEGCEFTIGRECASEYWFVYQINMDGFRFFKYVHELQNLFYWTTGLKLKQKGGNDGDV